jgi:hypothetical protein
MARSDTLKFESLEGRDQPSVFGNPWLNASKLTMSFATDGVQYSNQSWWGEGYTNQLHSTMNATMSPGVWQEEILRAFYAWSAQANLNIGLVPDNGLDFGPAGITAFGPPPADFRVGGINQSTEVLATSIPFHPLTGHHAGNLMLNTNQPFSKGGKESYDLYTVALHEVGNLLGMADNHEERNSARFGTYSLGKDKLLPSDVAAVKALYGSRPNDLFEGNSGNSKTSSASTLAVTADPAQPTRFRVVADGNITSSSDIDVYKFTTRAGTSSLTVRLGTAGKSLLAGKVELLDSSGRVLATQTNTSPLQGDTVLRFANAKANTTYFVRVTPGRSDSFSVGTYQLRVGMNYDPVSETKVDLIQRLGNDAGRNDSISTATTLTTTPGFTTNTQYIANATISKVDDVDYYRLTTPAATTMPMTISVQGLDGLNVGATVYTASGQQIASNIVLNYEGGLYRAQVPLVSPNTPLFIKIQIQDAEYSLWQGDYQLNVNFSQPLAVRTTALAGIANEQSEVALEFEVSESRAYTFSLNMVSSNVDEMNGFWVQFFDESGSEVAFLWTDGKDSVDTMTAVFKKGKYTARFGVDVMNGSTATAAFKLSAALVSDPIDVHMPSDDPLPSPPRLVTTDTVDHFYVGDPWGDPVGGC